MSMSSSRPYLVRALYDWIVENNFSPYVLVSTKVPGVEVPQEHVVNDKIIFNMSPQAVKDLHLGNETVEFSGRFSGKQRAIRIPIRGVLAIYAKENGRGMAFSEDDEGDGPPAASDDSRAASKNKSKLKLVK